MSLFGRPGLIALCVLVVMTAPSRAEPKSEGHPHKWETVDRSMADFLNDGFEVKSVVYDTAETGVKELPDVHYFLQKKAELVRCDFRKRGETSSYWCARLAAPHGQ